MQILVHEPVSDHGIPPQEGVSTVDRQSLVAYLGQLSRNCRRSLIKEVRLTLCMRIMKYILIGIKGKEQSNQFDFNPSLLDL